MLQKGIMFELCVVKDLMVQCIPAHYNILSIYTATIYQALSSHHQDILREDLDKQALFLLLEWALHAYHKSVLTKREVVESQVVHQQGGGLGEQWLSQLR